MLPVSGRLFVECGFRHILPVAGAAPLTSFLGNLALIPAPRRRSCLFAHTPTRRHPYAWPGLPAPLTIAAPPDCCVWVPRNRPAARPVHLEGTAAARFTCIGRNRFTDVWLSRTAARYSTVTTVLRRRRDHSQSGGLISTSGAAGKPGEQSRRNRDRAYCGVVRRTGGQLRRQPVTNRSQPCAFRSFQP